jgi:hypothetical protein
VPGARGTEEGCHAEPECERRRRRRERRRRRRRRNEITQTMTE